MIRRKLLSLLIFWLFLSTTLSVNKIRVSADTLSPYVRVVPDKTVDPTLTPGMNYNISIYTDYGGADVWGWQFTLTFNPNVLEGVSVGNGDLITRAKNTTARYYPGSGFNNTQGTLSLVSALFYYIGSNRAYKTSGPGTLAYVTFKVVDIGIANITLGEQTKLSGVTYDEIQNKNITYPIIDAAELPGRTEIPFGSDHIGHGYFNNVPNVHDVAVNKLVTLTNATRGDNVAINVTIRNEGNFTEIFDVIVHVDTTPIGIQAANLDRITDSARATEKTLTFYWNTTGILGGNYDINATASLPSDSDPSDNSKTTLVRILVHDVAVNGVTASHLEVMAGVPVTIYAIAANEGDFTETFNVTTYVNATEIGTQQVTNLAQSDEKTVTFNWDTTGLGLGTYDIEAVASNVTDEANSENNLNNSTITVAPYNMISSAIEVGGVTFHVVVRSNTIVSQSSFVSADKKISFSFTAEEGTNVFCNITIPKNLLDAPLEDWDVRINGTRLIPPELVATENVTHTFLNLTSTLSNGNVEIIGTTAATPPVAVFTFLPADPVIGDEMTFDASASYGAGIPLVSYDWDFGDGTREIYVGENLTATVTHTYATAGSHTVELKVTDSKGLQGVTQANVTVYTRDVAILSVTLDRTEVAIGETVSINVTVENEGDFPVPETFSVKTYANKTAISTPATVTDLARGALKVVDFVWNTSSMSPGVYLIKANATIVGGETETDDNEKMFDGTVIITKSSSTISISVTLTTIKVDQSTAISGTISPKRANVTVTIRYRSPGVSWSQLGNATTDNNSKYSYIWIPETVGTYEVRARWEGDDSAFGAESNGQILYVKAPPIASFTYTPSAPVAGETVAFTSNSTDLDGTIVSCQWDFNGDGVVDATTGSAACTYDAAGIYSVTFTVTDNDGLTGTITRSITVNETPPVQPQTDQLPDLLRNIALIVGVIAIISCVAVYLLRYRKKR